MESLTRISRGVLIALGVATVAAWLVTGGSPVTGALALLTVAGVVGVFAVPFLYGAAPDGRPRCSLGLRVGAPIALALVVVLVSAVALNGGGGVGDTAIAAGSDHSEHDEHDEDAQHAAGHGDEHADAEHDEHGAADHGAEHASTSGAHGHDDDHDPDADHGEGHGHDDPGVEHGHDDPGVEHGHAPGIEHGHAPGGDPSPGHPGHPSGPLLGQWNTMPTEGAGQRCVDGGPFGGDHDHTTHPVPLDAATQAAVDAQLDAAQAFALQFPTVASAVAGGYTIATTELPCIGQHLIRWNYPSDFGWVDGVFNAAQPEMLLYKGGQLVGVSYLFRGAAPPEGFAGPNDGWHRHLGLCHLNGIVIGTGLTSQQCANIGGQLVAEAAELWMAHAWVVPGWESDLGVFSDGNNKI